MKRWSNCLTVLGIWVLASLLATAYIGSHPLSGKSSNTLLCLSKVISDVEPGTLSER